MNDKIYIHECVDIIGHNRARYMHHMTANWCPTARAERNMLCFGVWGTVGSTGHWPQVVNVWELDGWDGLVANFSHELSSPTLQDPALAQWWAVAAGLRRGGLDRVLVPEPWTRSVEELTADGVRGEVYAHEIITVPVGTVRGFLSALAEAGVPAIEALDARCIGAFRVAMVNDSEAVVLWAFPSWDAWAAFEQAWDDGATLAPWRARVTALGADIRRSLMVDAPLAPLRTGRQPQIEDRRPLDDL